MVNSRPVSAKQQTLTSDVICHNNATQTHRAAPEHSTELDQTIGCHDLAQSSCSARPVEVTVRLRSHARNGSAGAWAASWYTTMLG
eukprot:4225831-Prymnesium_polylepis.2